MLDGNPCSIISNEFFKPGKGKAFYRVKFKDLITGKTLEKTFKSGESLEAADVMELEMQYYTMMVKVGILWIPLLLISLT